MIGAAILIPLAGNDGNPFTRRQVRLFEDRLAALSGGYTRRTGVTGVWHEDGQTFRDESREYLVALDSWLQLPAWLDLALWACGHFEQLAVFVEVAGIPEILRPS